MEIATGNQLGTAASSYLRSAAHQPIHWHEWGEAAFDAAKRENKPILLDIGAVWCHWCHVMDRESYEDAEVAKIVNEHFVAVKVDRDERPDIDIRYQAAVQAISGQGGWPLTAFLTPEGKPFFGGTYFPPVDQWGRPSFKRVLLSIAQAYREQHAQVAESADAVMNAISNAESFAGRSGEVTPSIADSMVNSALRMFDPQNGGFGSAPKFPHPGVLDVVIDQYARTGDERLRNLVLTTLTKMAEGGVYDQLAGGFHRYSVDERWVVPHFEKMAYDNSELLKNYVHAYQATGEALFAHVARDIIRWMDEWLSDRERGGFYASQDADYSLDDDGNYFTWSLDEAREALSEDELKVASLYYDIGEIGEMHHDHTRNVLFVRAQIPEISARLGTRTEQVQALLDSARQKMYAARLQRPTPYVDKTVYVGWNALCIAAYLEAARVLQIENARRFALRSLDRVLAEGWNSDRRTLKHVIAYSESKAPVNASTDVLDDYCFTVLACVDAYEATSDLTYLTFARSIGDAMIEKFFDGESGGFFDSAHTGNILGALSARRKPIQDSPTPAGNSAAAIALLRLHAYSNDESYRRKAQRTLATFAGVADQFGIFAATYGTAVRMFTTAHTQVVVIGEGAVADSLYAAAVAPFALGKAVLRFRRDQIVPQMFPPALAETLLNLPGVKDGSSVAVVCSGFACKPPISDPDHLSEVLRQKLQ